MSKIVHPYPLYDQIEYLKQPISKWQHEYLSSLQIENIQHEYVLCKQFLLAYQGSEDTFKSYRRDIERLCQWCWLLKNKNITKLTRADLTEYFNYVQAPDKQWISNSHHARFIEANGQRVPNPKWRPFLIRSTQDGIKAYSLSQSSLRACMASTSTFYTYLLQENIVDSNPVMNIRQKSRFLQKAQSSRITRKLSDTQWQVLVDVIAKKATEESRYMRHWFLIATFYLLGLRISELADTNWHKPTMGDFFRDSQNRWWFKTIGKGNKYREIAVPDALLSYLRGFRKHLGLSSLPSAHDNTPLVPKYRGQGSIGIRQLRKMIQEAFDLAIDSLIKSQQQEEADLMREATVHWLRHTAISHDVQFRPREHVRDDAGHRSVSVTDRYIEIDLEARHATAKHKAIIEDAVQGNDNNRKI